MSDPSTEENPSDTSFEQLGLDSRLLKSLELLQWSSMTLVQMKAIPLGMQGKDVMARARTGSGKTGAFCIPLIQKILTSSSSKKEPRTIAALILVPSQELCKQVGRVLEQLTKFCSKEVITCILESKDVKSLTVMTEPPNILVGTPNKVLSLQNRGVIDLSLLESLVVDEADLLFSFGYQNDMKQLVKTIPNIVQCFLMSATLSPQVDELRQLLMHQPVVLKLEESILPGEDRLTQFLIRCELSDKFLLLYVLLKLNLLKGKTIIFVNSVEKCYRLKLFLEQFAINSCVLNSELPHNSTTHIVKEFNKGVYDYIIASDEYDSEDVMPKTIKKSSLIVGNNDIECGVSRGIDFQNVANVINFDVPITFKSYVHRVGRTARGNKCGNSFLFVSMSEEKYHKNIENNLVESCLPALKPFGLKKSSLEGFRYRVADAIRAVTKIAIKEARIKEIKAELLSSEKLKAHFDENPRDLQALRHDRPLHPAKVRQHMRHIPNYLMPKSDNNIKEDEVNPKKKREMMEKKYREISTKDKRKKAEDPLKAFKFNKRSKGA
eukprot:Sdes_comp20830_c0_seq1m17422